jgi:hypothetical protein
MRLYKYRDLSTSGGEAFARLSDILRTNAFWCAGPSTLNDPTEFVWECDYEPSNNTSRLLADAIVKSNGRPLEIARVIAGKAVENRRIETHARPVIESMIEQCRAEVGLACFATSGNNDMMWERYGGQGNGVCVEIEAADELLHTQLHLVEYPVLKRLHIDQMLASYTDHSFTQAVYTVALLSKPPIWAPEREVRFVSRRQSVSVNISGSRISRLILGQSLTADVAARIESLVNSLPYELPIFSRVV